jgi:hypothetical protein
LRKRNLFPAAKPPRNLQSLLAASELKSPVARSQPAAAFMLP